MSKPRVNIYLVTDTRPHAESIMNSFNSALLGKPVFEIANEQSKVEVFEDEEGAPVFSASVRFSDDAARDNICRLVKQLAASDSVVSKWVKKGSKISVHQCTHDDPEIVSCKTTEYAVEFER